MLWINDLYKNTTLVDELDIVLSRFLCFLVVSQNSLSIHSIQDSSQKKQILSFCKIRADWILPGEARNMPSDKGSCILNFSSESFSLSFLVWFFLLIILARFLFTWILPWIFFLKFLIDCCNINLVCFYINMSTSFRYYYI